MYTFELYKRRHNQSTVEIYSVNRLYKKADLMHEQKLISCTVKFSQLMLERQSDLTAKERDPLELILSHEVFEGQLQPTRATFVDTTRTGTGYLITKYSLSILTVIRSNYESSRGWQKERYDATRPSVSRIEKRIH